MTRIPAHSRPTNTLSALRNGPVPRSPTGGRSIVAGARPRSPVARAARVAIGAAAAAGVIVCGLWLTFAARRLAEPSGVARPDLLEVGLRCGGLAVIAAAQVVVRSAVVGAIYPLRRADRMFEWAAWAVMLVAAVGAVAFGLSGW